MPLGLDNHLELGHGGNDVWTPSYTVGALGNYLILTVASGHAMAVTPTFDGVAMSLLASFDISATDTCAYRMYGLASPSTGAKLFSLDTSGGAPQVTSICIASFNGVASVSSVVTDFHDDAANNVLLMPQTVGAGQIAYASGGTINRPFSAPVMTLLGQDNSQGDCLSGHAYKAMSVTDMQSCELDISVARARAGASIVLTGLDGPPSKILKPNVLRPRAFKGGLAR